MHPVHHRVHHKDLATLLEVARPRSLLLIDPEHDPLPPTTLPADCQRTHLTDNILATLDEHARFDLAVVANTLEYLDRRTAGILLARLRDVQAHRLIVLVPLGHRWEALRSYWRTADLLSYGMTILSCYQVEGKPLQLFHYTIESYKTTPEWFNSRHWANPEHWRP